MTAQITVQSTSAKLYRPLLFPWTTPVSWRGETCYVGKSWPSCLDCPGLHSGESTSVCRSMVSGDQRMPTTTTTITAAIVLFTHDSKAVQSLLLSQDEMQQDRSLRLKTLAVTHLHAQYLLFQMPNKGDQQSLCMLNSLNSDNSERYFHLYGTTPVSLHTTVATKHQYFSSAAIYGQVIFTISTDHSIYHILI